jgi:hypothetical protein
MNTQVPEGEQVSQALVSVREKAAVLGAFSPISLLPTWFSPTMRREVLRQLVAECNEVETDEGLFWMLKPEVRRETLVHLNECNSLKAKASDVSSIASDDFGRAMVSAILNWNTSYSEKTEISLSSQYAALQFLDPIFHGNSSGIVERQLERQEAEVELDFARGGGLVGRQTELQSLKEFVFMDWQNAKPSRNSAPNPFLISGIGGSGKSALVAEFVRDVRGSDWQQVPALWFDFDDPELISLDSGVLLQEFARQLALHREDLANSLANFQREIAQLRATSSYAPYMTDEKSSADSTVWALWRTMLFPALDTLSTVVLVFDTFEEVVVRGDSAVRSVQQWISNLYFDGGIKGLRPVISGRVLPHAWEKDFIKKDLGDLAPSEARELLTNLLKKSTCDTEKFPLAALVERFGGNPLLIKILARYLAEEGLQGANELLSDSEQKGPHRIFAQGFLYTRILRRMREEDKDVERLAFPGLVLRRVTPTIIKEVLAEPCGIEQMTSARANSLFEKLAKQVWLVERAPGDQALTHRKDLRRVMLAVVKDVEPEKATEIHRNAQRYYAAKKDLYLAEHEQMVEAGYHGLFLGEVNVGTALLAESLLKSVGEDILSVPPAARAQLKAVAGYEIAVNERIFLSKKAQRDHDYLVMERHLARGEYIPDVAERSVKYAEKPTEGALDAFVANLYASLRFEQILSYAEDIIVDFIRPKSRARKNRALTATPIWHLALAAMAMGQPQRVARFLDPGTRASLIWKSFSSKEKSDQITNNGLPFDRAISTIIAFLGANEYQSGGGRMPYHARIMPILTLDQWREFQFRDKSSSDVPWIRIKLGLLRFASKDFWSFLDSIEGSVSNNRGLIQPMLEIDRSKNGFRTFAEIRENLARRRMGYLRGRALTETIIEIPFLPSNRLPIALAQGVCPDLYAPIKTLVKDSTNESIINFARKVEGPSSGFWPIELSAIGLSDALGRDRTRWTSSLVEEADKCGHLSTLITYFSDRGGPNQRKWLQILKVYRSLNAPL